jgi:GT2 family glycosyltransferase
MKIAVLLTTFNRKEKTLACLKKLNQQELPKDIELEVFLTDDASADGTAAVVNAQFPLVHVYPGTGHMYWAGGMRNSWQYALKTLPDYYLLLNDDTFIADDAITRLLQCCVSYYKQCLNYAICVGRTKDPDSGKLSYGGRKLYSKHRIQSYLVPDNQEIVACDMGEANIMLVPREIVDKIGILSCKYTHAFADIDYTLKAQKAGFKVIIPPGILGDCKNDHGKNWKSSDTRLSQRVKFMYSPKGLAYKEYLYFMHQHFPLQTPAAFFKIWLKTLFPIVYDRFKKTAI